MTNQNDKMIKSIRYLSTLGKLNINKDGSGRTTAKLMVKNGQVGFDFVARSSYGGADAIRLLTEKVKNEQAILDEILKAA